MNKKPMVLAAVFGIIALAAWAQEKKDVPAQERKVKEADVPKSALDALKKIANGAVMTDLAEEIEHGRKFYEGSWKGPNGNVDTLVTEGGDLVEIEEAVPTDKVPAAVRTEVEKTAGKDAKPAFEKKTVVMYEAHFKKDGKSHEIVLTPDGRREHEEQSKKPGVKDEDPDEDD